MYHIQVDLSASKNSWSSIGSPLRMVIASPDTPAVAQAVDRALRRIAVRIERVDGAHACVSPSGVLAARRPGDSAGDGCSPAFISQIEMIGTNFANST